MKLCSTTPIQQIMIQDIVAECGISKQTFYNHFKDKFALMNYAYKIEADYVSATFIKKEGDIKKAMQYIFERCLEHKNYYSAIAKYEAQNSFARFFLQNVKEFYTSYVTEKWGEKALTPAVRYAIEFNCSGSAQLFLGWIKSGMNENSKTMASEIYSCMPVTLKELII